MSNIRKKIGGKMIGLYAFLCFLKYPVINKLFKINDFSLNLVLKNMSRASEQRFDQSGFD